MSKPIHQILIRPILTEKSVSHNIEKKYTFVVAVDASKPEIAAAVEELFSKEKVKVKSVNTMHVRGKERRNYAKRGRQPGRGVSPSWKKAIVTLTPDSPNLAMLEGA